MRRGSSPKKRVSAAAAVYAFALALAAAPASAAPPPISAPAEPIEYYNASLGVRIVFPAGWVLVPDLPSGVLVMARTVAHTHSGPVEVVAAVSTMELVPNTNADSLLAALSRAILDGSTGFRRVTSGPMPVGGINGVYGVFQFRLAGVERQSVAACVVRGNRGYAITCHTTVSGYSLFERDFERIVASFRFDAHAAAGAAEGRYINTDGRFSIVFPKNWAVRPNRTGPVAVRAISLQEDDVDDYLENMTITVGRRARDIDVDVYSADALKRLSAHLPAFRLVDSGPAEIAGLPARFIVYYSSSGPHRLISAGWFVAHGTIGYEITGTTEEAKYPSMKDLFSGVAASFRIEYHTPDAHPERLDPARAPELLTGVH